MPKNNIVNFPNLKKLDEIIPDIILNSCRNIPKSEIKNSVIEAYMNDRISFDLCERIFLKLDLKGV